MKEETETYMSGFEKLVPMTKIGYTVVSPGFVVETRRALSPIRSSWKMKAISYLREAEGFLKQNDMVCPQRILLVTDDDNVAKKTAVYLNEWDALEEEVEDPKVHCVDLRQKTEFMKGVNMSPAVIIASSLPEEDAIFFYGCQNLTLSDDQYKSILVANTRKTFVTVSLADYTKNWVQTLILKLGYVPLFLEPLQDDYYVALMQHMLSAYGYTLEDGLTVQDVIILLREKYGESFDEELLERILQIALATAMERGKTEKILRQTDLIDLFWQKCMTDTGAKKTLMKMTGLTAVKELACKMEALAYEEKQNRKLSGLHHHMIFAGNPGTGKTTCASLLARMVSEVKGERKPFVIASRKDLVGSFVGHTAPLVAKAFEAARKGFLFVDEAGFFLNQQSGGFVTEALREFVRYMEEYPDVTVIFAMYSREVEEFLGMDDGLSSRIRHIIPFADYDKEQLYEIADQMATEYGYWLDAACKEQVYAYIDQKKKKKRTQFGNAREMRNLVEEATTQLCMRHRRRQIVNGDETAARAETSNGGEAAKADKKRKVDKAIRRNKVAEPENIITQEDMIKACRHLLEDSLHTNTGQTFGFVNPDNVSQTATFRKSKALCYA